MRNVAAEACALSILALALGACADSVPTDPGPQAVPSGAAAEPSVKYRWTVVSGFDNPRGLAFGPDGHLYVAEAGTGGTTSTAGQCAQEPPPIGPFTGGLTARISRVSRQGTRETMASGLPSATGALGDVVGVADIAFLDGRLYALVAAGGCSHGHVSAPAGIYRVARDGNWRAVANFSRFYRANPAANPDLPSFSPDGSLYAMAAEEGSLYFTEANQKGLFKWTPGEGFSRVADFSALSGPQTPTALSLHGPLLVSDFGVIRGPTIGVGTESVYRVTRNGGTRLWATGFTKVLGLALHGGSLYVLEAASQEVFAPGSGRVLRVNDRGRGDQVEVVVSGLYFPTSIVIGPDGALYVSNRGFGAAPGTGEVLRIPL
jgi:glucose/arabinose dehydrogenase